MKRDLLLSCFPGVGLLDRGFEAIEKFCVVRGPDTIWGGDIRRFHTPASVFTGIFGGSPCQDFSLLRHDSPTGQGEELLFEFGRVIYEGQPRWALIENVPQVPNIEIPGYVSKRIPLSDAKCGGITLRIRHFQYFFRPGDTWPRIERRSRHKARGVKYSHCVLASGGAHRNGKWLEILAKHGLPGSHDKPIGAFQCRKRSVKVTALRGVGMQNLRNALVFAPVKIMGLATNRTNYSRKIT